MHARVTSGIHECIFLRRACTLSINIARARGVVGRKRSAFWDRKRGHRAVASRAGACYYRARRDARTWRASSPVVERTPANGVVQLAGDGTTITIFTKKNVLPRDAVVPDSNVTFGRFGRTGSRINAIVYEWAPLPP